MAIGNGKSKQESTSNEPSSTSRNSGFNGKYKAKSHKFDPALLLGEIAHAILQFVINPNFIYFMCLGLAGCVFFLNAIPFINLFGGELKQLSRSVEAIPLIGWLLGIFRVAISSLLGVSLLLVVTGLELMPLAPRIIGQWGERLYFKQNRKRFEAPYSGEHAPSIIPRAYTWVRNAVEKQHDVGLIISLVNFTFDFWVCARTYPVTGSLGAISYQNTFYVLVLVFGVIWLLYIAAIFNSHRLNRDEAEEFHAMKEQLEPRKYSQD